ncbi:MAG: hypothetical protein ABI574_04650 [Burkholderiales bacterium]
MSITTTVSVGIGREPPMITLSTKTVTEGDRFVGLAQRCAARVIALEDEAIRRALIQLGWTPPPTKGKPPAPKARFDGSDYEPGRDDERLQGQLGAIWDLMKGGDWLTLSAISLATDAPQASVSAQLRHLRKERFGGHTVEKRLVKRGLYEYRLSLAQ